MRQTTMGWTVGSMLPRRRGLGLHALAAVLLPLALAACGGEGNSTDSPPATASPAAGFSVEVTPADAIAFAGSGRLLTVSLKRSDSFTADVTVALADPPQGVTAQSVIFTGSIANLTLRVTLDDDVAAGNLGLAFNASSGSSSVGTTAKLSVQAAQPPAQDLIANALAANTIDRDTALLYRLYALAGDPRLPEALVGSGSAEDDWRVFVQVEAALPQMSAAMQAAVRPFLVRPDHPESIYRRPGTNARASKLSVGSGQRKTAAAAPPPSTCAAGAQWRSVRSTTIPVRVWSECYADDFLTQWNSELANKDLLVFEKIWPSMTRLMGAPRLDGEAIFDDAGKDITDNGGDDAIDVYLVASYSLSRASRPINTAALGTNAGFARPAGECVKNGAGTLSCSGYMVLPAADAGTRGQRATIIHELFHVLQFRLNTSLAFVEDWFYEASATWAESHYDRELDWDPKVALTEVHQPRFKRFMATTGSVNDTRPTLRPYAAYIWPFFLEQEKGSVIIGQIWTALQSARTLADEDRIVDAAYGFDANFHRFALRNVNEKLGDDKTGPVVNRYIDLAGVDVNGVNQFPDGVVKPKYVTSTLSAGAEETRRYGIEPWSAEYAKFLVNGAALPNRVEFDFSGLQDRGSLKLDALILTTTPTTTEEGATWVNRPIPLNPDAKAIFCFDLGPSSTTVRGEFKELRLVLSNSARDRRITGDVIVRPTAKPCGVWAGTIDSTHEFPLLPLGTLKVTSSAQMAFAFDETNSDSGTRAFQVRSGNYTYRAYYDFPQRNPPCRTEQTASGAMHAQGESMDLRDGSTAGLLATFNSPDGKPQYSVSRILTFTTLTEVSNCNDRNVDVTTLLPMSTMALWALPDQHFYDIEQNGTTMQGTLSYPNSTGTSSYTWLLTKKTE